MQQNVCQKLLPMGFIAVFLQFWLAHGLDRPDEIVPVNDGDTATLQCDFQSISSIHFGRLTWTKDGVEKIVLLEACEGTLISSCNISVTAPRKYSLEGDLMSGFTLQVSRVTLNDDGIYQCKVISLQGIVLKSFRLAILRPPTQILILDIDKNLRLNKVGVMHVVSGRPNRLNCTVPSSNPEAGIEWSYGDVRTTVHEQTNQSHRSDVPMMTSTRAIDIFPTADDKGSIISCKAKHFGLSSALQINTTLLVGRLPDGPRDVSVLDASVTSNSFTITWIHSSSDGYPQTYNVQYCLSLVPDQCLEISGIGSTRVKIGDLLPFTSYIAKVSSQNAFGFSEDNEIIVQSTKPLSPAELGIKAEYNARENSVDVTRENPNLIPLPRELCFQLVQTSSLTSADPTAEESQCMGVNKSIPIPHGWSLDELAIVTYGNAAYSVPSKIAGITKVRTGLIVGITLVGIIITVAAIILVKVKKRNGIKRAQAMRQLPHQPKLEREKEETSAQYHYVDDTVQDVYQAGEHYETQHSYEEGTPASPDDNQNSADYSMKIAKTKAGDDTYEKA